MASVRGRLQLALLLFAWVASLCHGNFPLLTQVMLDYCGTEDLTISPENACVFRFFSVAQSWDECEMREEAFGDCLQSCISPGICTGLCNSRDVNDANCEMHCDNMMSCLLKAADEQSGAVSAEYAARKCFNGKPMPPAVERTHHDLAADNRPGADGVLGTGDDVLVETVRNTSSELTHLFDHADRPHLPPAKEAHILSDKELKAALPGELDITPPGVSLARERNAAPAPASAEDDEVVLSPPKIPESPPALVAPAPGFVLAPPPVAAQMAPEQWAGVLGPAPAPASAPAAPGVLVARPSPLPESTEEAMNLPADVEHPSPNKHHHSIEKHFKNATEIRSRLDKMEDKMAAKFEHDMDKVGDKLDNLEAHMEMAVNIKNQAVADAANAAVKIIGKSPTPQITINMINPPAAAPEAPFPLAMSPAAAPATFFPPPPAGQVAPGQTGQLAPELPGAPATGLPGTPATGLPVPPASQPATGLPAQPAGAPDQPATQPTAAQQPGAAAFTGATAPATARPTSFPRPELPQTSTHFPRPMLPQPKSIRDPTAPLSDDPCVCSFSGVIMGMHTGLRGCQVHGKEPKAPLQKYCMVEGGHKCLKAEPSAAFVGQYWRTCKTPVDNIAMVMPKSCKVLTPPVSRVDQLHELQAKIEKWDVVYHHPKDVTVKSSEGLEEARALVKEIKDWSTTKSPSWRHQHHMETDAKASATDASMLPKALQEVKPSKENLTATLHSHSSDFGKIGDIGIASAASNIPSASDIASLLPKAELPSASSGGGVLDYLFGSEADGASTTPLPRTNFLRGKEERKSLIGGMLGWFSGKTENNIF